jgi:hypothetical protein
MCQVIQRQVSKYLQCSITSSEKQRTVALCTMLLSHKYKELIFSIRLAADQINKAAFGKSAFAATC